ncbi:hypothetical protein INR49_027628 [Caranx melampygus]|nr:hypothetical protein INR49_027628 [Caranx melampygus]
MMSLLTLRSLLGGLTASDVSVELPLKLMHPKPAASRSPQQVPLKCSSLKQRRRRRRRDVIAHNV